MSCSTCIGSGAPCARGGKGGPSISTTRGARTWSRCVFCACVRGGVRERERWRDGEGPCLVILPPFHPNSLAATRERALSPYPPTPPPLLHDILTPNPPSCTGLDSRCAWRGTRAWTGASVGSGAFGRRSRSTANSTTSGGKGEGAGRGMGGRRRGGWARSERGVAGRGWDGVGGHPAAWEIGFGKRRESTLEKVQRLSAADSGGLGRRCGVCVARSFFSCCFLVGVARSVACLLAYFAYATLCGSTNHVQSRVSHSSIVHTSTPQPLARLAARSPTPPPPPPPPPFPAPASSATATADTAEQPAAAAAAALARCCCVSGSSPRGAKTVRRRRLDTCLRGVGCVCVRVVWWQDSESGG
jgi:hypothetical protein